MTHRDFILLSLGIGTQDNAIEKIADTFCIDYGRDDVWQVMCDCNGHYAQFNNLFISFLFKEVIDKHSSIYLDEDKWDYECNSICSNLYYNQEVVSSPEDIDKEIESKKSEVLAYILDQIAANDILAAYDLMCRTHSTLSVCNGALAIKICDELQEYQQDSDMSWSWLEKITEAYEEVFFDLHDAISHEQ